MFYCDGCAREREWPVSLSRSLGLCELCGRKRVCNDVHSSKLPKKKEEPKEEVTHLDKLKHELNLKAFRKQAEEKFAKVD